MFKLKGGDTPEELERVLKDLTYFKSIGFTDDNLRGAINNPRDANQSLVNLMREFQRITGRHFTSFDQLNDSYNIDPSNPEPFYADAVITYPLLDPIIATRSDGTCKDGYMLTDGMCKLIMPSSLILSQLKHYKEIDPAILNRYNENRINFVASDRTGDNVFFDRLVRAFEQTTRIDLKSFKQLDSYTSIYEDFRQGQRPPMPTNELIQDLLNNIEEFKRQTGIPLVYTRQLDKLLDTRTGPDTDTAGRVIGPSEYQLGGARRKMKKTRKYKKSRK